MKYLIEIDDMLGAENPEATHKMIVNSLKTMCGVKSCEKYIEKPTEKSKSESLLRWIRWTQGE